MRRRSASGQPGLHLLAVASTDESGKDQGLRAHVGSPHAPVLSAQVVS